MVPRGSTELSLQRPAAEHVQVRVKDYLAAGTLYVHRHAITWQAFFGR
jgi:hypothetical protein